MIKMKKPISFLVVGALLISVVFAGCSNNNNNSRSGTVSTSTPTEALYTDKNGVSYNQSPNGELYVSKFSGKESNLKIPSEIKGKTVKSIGRSSLKMSKVKTVVIPDTVESIDDYAFAFSKNLESVIIPDSVKTIGTCAFAGCAKLKNVKLSKNLNSIGMYCFDATAVEKIDIPKSVNRIKAYAFAECKKLNEIIINSNNTEIDDTAFNKSANVTIIAPKNSKAIKYAESKKIKYKVK
jgi:hypothetical protein